VSDRAALRRGRVSEFDPEAGLGRVASDGTEYPFHCTEIADGSRVIAVGTEVAFGVVAGHLGRWEAAGVRPYPSAGGSADPPAGGSAGDPGA
jgi:cold shock CspA family protein